MAIQSYQILAMGTGYTYQSIQDMEYYDFALISTCKFAEIKIQMEQSQNAVKGLNTEKVKYAPEVNAYWT